jgi:hypothetical protein
MRALTATEQSRMLGEMPEAARTELTAFVISWRPVTVTFSTPRKVAKNGTVTPESTLSPQTIRIDGDSRANLVRADAGAAPVWQAEITAMPDADIDEGYTFVHAGNHYRITEVWHEAGRIRAIALVNG